MSPLSWLACGGVIVGSLAFGALLGGYAAGALGSGGSGLRPEIASLSEQMGNPDAAYPDGEIRKGPAAGPTGPIICKGCGPTLADRRLAADRNMFPLGEEDPVVQRYMAQEDSPEGPGYAEAVAVSQPGTAHIPVSHPPPLVSVRPDMPVAPPGPVAPVALAGDATP